MDRNDLTRLQQDDVTALAGGCVNGAPPPCARECPFGLETRTFIARASKGRWQTAFKTYRDAVVFPEIVSRLCHAPCRGACTRNDCGGTINLAGIERAAVKYAKNKRRDSYVIPQKNKRIAIVGAGPAGLSVALCLSLKRYLVTVFERAQTWGGTLKDHAEFAVFDEEIRESFAPLDVEFRFGATVEQIPEGFDAVYIATGAGGDSFGLAAEFDDVLLSTTTDGVFLGGELVGMDLMTAIARGRAASQSIEAYLQTGKPSLRTEGKCSWRPDTEKIDAASGIEEGADGYSGEQAQAEAARCLQCDCEICYNGCEMLRRFNKMPVKIAGEVYSDTRANPPYSSRTLTREAYSCNDCGRCARLCPEDINVGEMLRLSRRTRIALGNHPVALHDYWLREMDFSVGQASLVASDGACEYLFFPGCQLGAYNPQHVLRSVEALRRNYSVGVYLGCCGAPSYWAGDDERSAANTAEIIDTWQALGQPKFIFACATCMRIFDELMPEIDGVSLYELLAGCDGLTPTQTLASAAVFDPCSAADENMRACVRTIAQSAGIALTELGESRKCCGYGGHMRLGNPSLYEEITENRVTASAEPYIVYCANCRDVFASREKQCAHILDIAFGTEPVPSPDIDTRRKNSLEVKRVIAEEYSLKEVVPDGQAWDALRLKISPELAEEIDRKLISLSDLREAIYRAATDGALFIGDDGVQQCSMVRSALVYWVKFRQNDDEYEILDAYYHRMKFGEDENG